METLTMNYSQIAQMFNYFKSMENIPDLTFSNRRKLIRFNELLEKESNLMNKEIQKIIDNYSEKDEDGNPIQEGNGVKLQKDKVEEANRDANEIYNTTIEITFQPFKIKEQYFENFKCTTDVLKLIEEYFLEEEQEQQEQEKE